MPRLFCSIGLALSLAPVALAEGGTRFVTYNIEDLRAEAIADPHDEQAKAAIAVIRALEPDVLLVNELHYDGPTDAPGTVRQGTAAHAFAERIAAAHPTLQYQVVVAPVNTGVPSGRDLDRNGVIETTPGSRAYGNDCLGFGTFPGQYGMALFVREGITVDWDGVRTFKNLRWGAMPDNLLPPQEQFHLGLCRDTRAMFPLSSKSHWDVPIVLANGARVHVLVSHPTPPVFDGPEDRNGRRNHDEIRLWAAYLNDAAWIVDDAGAAGGLVDDAHFVIMGDLNADPVSGEAIDDPVTRLLIEHPRVQVTPAPTSRHADEGGRADLTARFGLRVDYVLVSAGAEVQGSGVYRGPSDLPGAQASRGAGAAKPIVERASDHFPVWAMVSFPPIAPQPEAPDD